MTNRLRLKHGRFVKSKKRKTMRTDPLLPGIVIFDEHAGLIRFCTSAGPPTTTAIATNRFAPSCIVQDSTTSKIYQNESMTSTPSWGNVENSKQAVTVGFSDADYICDGAADDVQINAAIAYINSRGGGKVYVKESSVPYDITDSIILFDKVDLSGPGSSTVLKANASLAGAKHMIQNYDLTSGNVDIRIHDLYLDGNHAARTGSVGTETGCNIFLKRSSYCSVYNVHSVNSFSANIAFCNGTHNSSMFNNVAVNAGTHNFLIAGSETGPTNTYENTVYGNISRDAGQDGTFGVGFEIAIYAIKNIVSNNVAINSKEGGIHIYERSNYNIVSDNQIADCDQNGISIVDESDYNTITGNMIRTPANVGVSSTTYLLTYGGKQNLISNNYISSCGWNGIRGGFTGCTISDNIIDSCGASGTSTQTHGCYITTSDNLRFEDNRITSSTGNGAQFIDQTNILASGNYSGSNTTLGLNFLYSVVGTTDSIVSNNIAEGNGGNGISLNGQAKRSSIVGNVCRSNTQSGLDIRGANDCSITGNVCTNNTFYGIRMLDDANVIGCTDCVITGNNCSTNATGGFAEQNSSDRNLITSNTFLNNTLADFAYVGANSIVRNNVGVDPQKLYAQGNVTGGTTFNRLNGQVITATLTGNITVTLTNGVGLGDELTLQLTQDGTGNRTATWPANFKKAGGSLTLSVAAAAVDEVTMTWNGTNWIEKSRSLSVS